MLDDEKIKLVETPLASPCCVARGGVADEGSDGGDKGKQKRIKEMISISSLFQKNLKKYFDVIKYSGRKTKKKVIK